jgi:RNA polymerase sigma-32 factor
MSDEKQKIIKIEPVEQSHLPVPAKEIIPEKINIFYRYLKEISRHKLLSPEEEMKLTSQYVRTRDPSIAYRLVTANLRLVVKIAFEYSSYTSQIMDLIQEGNIGLVQAVKKFDPLKGVRLSHYAQYWIRSYIIYYLLNNYRLVKIGTTQAQRKIFFNLRKERDHLLSMGFAPSPKLLAERLDVPEEVVTEMIERLDMPEISLDAPVNEDSRVSYMNLISGGTSPEKIVSQEEVEKKIFSRIHQFEQRITSEREKYIWEKRLLSDDPITLQEIGEKFNISRERARQVEERLKKKLKDFLKKELGSQIKDLSFLDKT